MQKCSCQIVQEQKLRLEPHFISIVVRLLVDCGCGCGTDRNTNDLKHENTKEKTLEDFGMTILPYAVSEESNKNISGLL